VPEKRDPNDIEARIKRLLSLERQELLDPFEVMAFLPIEAHHHVADIGCGPGYFTIPLAKHLLFGKVYALDVLDRMLEETRKRAKASYLGNVEVLKCQEASFPVPARSLDGALVAFVLHETQKREELLRAAGDLLKPGGWLAVLEWQDKDEEGVPSPDRRVRPQELESLARKAGFQVRQRRELNPKHYMVLLRK
jgi:ubiquinone/menaquinone biosynthesis C-methylase UbiE